MELINKNYKSSNNGQILILILSILFSIFIAKTALQSGIDIVIGLGFLIVFGILFLMRRVEKSLILIIAFVIISPYLAIIAHEIHPISGTNFTSGSSFYLLILTFLFLMYQSRDRKSIMYGKYSAMIILYFGYFLLLSLFWRGSIIANLKSFSSSPILMIFYFLGLRYFKSKNNIIFFFKALAIIYLINIFYAISQQIFGFLPFHLNYLNRTQEFAFIKTIDVMFGHGYYYKLSGFSGHVYDFYYITTMLFIIFISSYKFLKEKINSKLLISYIIFFVVLMLITLERGPIFMLAAIPICYYKNKKKFIISIIIFVIIYLLLVVFNDVLFSSGSRRFLLLSEVANPLGQNTSLTGRAEMRWSYMVPMIFRNPLGIGVSAVKARYAHNNFISIFLQTGWIGGLIFFYVIIKIIKDGFKIASSLSNSQYSSLAFGVIASMIAMVAMGIPNIPFNYDSAILFWLGAALLEKLPWIINQENNVSNLRYN